MSDLDGEREISKEDDVGLLSKLPPNTINEVGISE